VGKLSLLQNHLKVRHFIFAALSVVYLVVSVQLATRLWFWWDEWTILRSQDSQFWGLLQGHFGNFFPLGRLVFLAETRVFGNFYAGIVAVNSLLVLITCYTVWRIVTHAPPKNRWLPTIAVGGLVTYATAAGVVFDVVWGFQVAWLLSILLAVLGSYLVIVHGLNPKYSIVLLLLSWLSFNSNFIPATLLYLALMYAGHQKPLRMRWIFNYLILTSIAIFLTGTGLLIARLNPSVEPRAQSSGVEMLGSLSELQSALAETAAGSILWLLTPIAFLLGTRPDLLQEYGPTLAASPRLLILITVLIAAVALGAIGVRNIRDLKSVFAVLLPLITVMALVSFRGQGDFDTSFNLRYAPSVLLPATIFWVLLLALSTPSRGSINRTVSLAITVLVAVTATLSTYSFVSQNPDSIVVFGRGDQQSQLKLLENCQDAVSSEIEPAPFQSFTPEEFCDLFTSLQ
jgi:hypothetical protein